MLNLLTITSALRVLYFLAQRMPFEKILQLKHPDQDDYPEFEDGPPWTADELLSTYALNQGPLFHCLTYSPLAYALFLRVHNSESWYVPAFLCSFLLLQSSVKIMALTDTFCAM